jgi:hypothetical protein
MIVANVRQKVSVTSDVSDRLLLAVRPKGAKDQWMRELN